MLRDKTGNKLFRHVRVNIVYPKDTLPSETFTHRAGPRQGYSPGNIDDILLQTAGKLEELYPYWDFKLNELTPEGRTARYTLTVCGYRPVKPAAPKVEQCAQL